MSSSASAYGNGFRSSRFTTPKIAVFAPMPSASVSTVTHVNQRFFSSSRQAFLRSRNIGLIGSQRDNRIDARGAPCRQPARAEGSEHEQRDDAHERQRIARRDAVQHA